MIDTVRKLLCRYQESKRSAVPAHRQACLTPKMHDNFRTLWARPIFVSDCKNPLAVAMAMLCGIFMSIHQKLDTRRINTIYRS